MSFDAVVLGPGEGAPIWQLGNEFTVKATAEQTGGSYSLLEQVCAGAPPPLHVHDHEEEAFYVLDGTVDLYLGDDVMTVEAGSFCLIPRGVAHTFRSSSGIPARMLVVLSPPGFERFFEAVEQRFPHGNELPAPEVVGATLGQLAGGYGLRIVGPPPT